MLLSAYSDSTLPAVRAATAGTTVRRGAASRQHFRMKKGEHLFSNQPTNPPTCAPAFLPYLLAVLFCYVAFLLLPPSLSLSLSLSPSIA